MLSNELMAGLGLSIVWINALLIAAAALGELRALHRRLARLNGPLLRGVVLRGDGPDNALASHSVEQLGQAADARSGLAIHFKDRAYRSTVYGGAIALSNASERTIAAASDERAEVWVEPHDPSVAPDGAALERAWDESKRSSGYLRTLRGALGEGAAVAVALPAGETETTWVFDEPSARRWIARRRALVAVFIALELAALAGATALCFAGGSFASLVTKLGAAACVGWFLGVQPIGVAVSEACRPPHRAPVRGQWRRP